MSVHWTQKALVDLDGIYDVIAADKPRVAEHVLRALIAQGQDLGLYPRRGRAGRIPATREWVVPRLPYILVYELSPSATTAKPDVSILRVIHGAMKWPPLRR